MDTSTVILALASAGTLAGGLTTRDDFLAEFPSEVEATTFEELALTDGRPLPEVAARVLADEDYTPPPEYYAWLLGQVSLSATAAIEAAYEAAQQREVQADART